MGACGASTTTTAAFVLPPSSTTTQRLKPQPDADARPAGSETPVSDRRGVSISTLYFFAIFSYILCALGDQVTLPDQPTTDHSSPSTCPRHSTVMLVEGRPCPACIQNRVRASAPPQHTALPAPLPETLEPVRAIDMPSSGEPRGHAAIGDSYI